MLSHSPYCSPPPSRGYRSHRFFAMLGALIPSARAAETIIRLPLIAEKGAIVRENLNGSVF